MWQLSLRFTPTGEPTRARPTRCRCILAPAPVIAADAALGLPAATVARSGAPPLRDGHAARRGRRCGSSSAPMLALDVAEA